MDNKRNIIKEFGRYKVSLFTKDKSNINTHHNIHKISVVSDYLVLEGYAQSVIMYPTSNIIKIYIDAEEEDQ